MDIITDSADCEDAYCLVDDGTEFAVDPEPLRREDDERANEVRRRRLREGGQRKDERRVNEGA